MSQPQAAADQDYKNAPDNPNIKHIAGRSGLPYFGMALELVADFEKTLRKHHEKFGDVSRVQLMYQPGLFIAGVENMQMMLLDRDKNFSAEMGYAESLGYFYPGGLLLRDFNDHKFQRRILQTAFKTPAMKTYVDEMNPVMKKHIDSWQGKSPVEFFPVIKECLLEVGAKVFVGLRDENPDDMKRLNDAFLDINEGLMGLVRKEIPGTRFNAGIKGRKYLTKVFAELVPQRRESESPDMLSHMCREKTDDGDYFDSKDIVDHMVFLLFAAHDTTTSVINHVMYYSAKHPEWQQRMREECLALGKDKLDYEDLDQLTSIDLVFNECLRLHPSVSLFTRRNIRETEINGHVIPPNTMMWILPYINHRDEKYWTNPYDFDPERFSPERAEHKNHAFCYTPFGGGAHKCIGMHFANMLTKTFMYSMLTSYKYHLPQGFEAKFEWVPLPKPKKLPIHFEKL